MFNEIHRNRIPGLLGNWQLLEQAIGFMSLGLVAHANGAGFAVVFDKTSDARPGEISLNHFKGFVHTKVSRQDVIVLVLFIVRIVLFLFNIKLRSFMCIE